jgi:hypothetical protein
LPRTVEMIVSDEVAKKGSRPRAFICRGREAVAETGDEGGIE